jgi:hypothetical protein
LAFQFFDFECTWWRLFQKCVVPIFWLWVYLMKVIPEVCRANLLTLSVPDDGYSRSMSCQSFDFECTWWWLFQKCVVPIFWLWVYLMKVIPETCRAHTKLDIYVFITFILIQSYFWNILDKAKSLLFQSNVSFKLLWICSWISLSFFGSCAVNIFKKKTLVTPSYSTYYRCGY